MHKRVRMMRQLGKRALLLILYISIPYLFTALFGLRTPPASDQQILISNLLVGIVGIHLMLIAFIHEENHKIALFLAAGYLGLAIGFSAYSELILRALTPEFLFMEFGATGATLFYIGETALAAIVIYGMHRDKKLPDIDLSDVVRN